MLILFGIGPAAIPPVSGGYTGTFIGHADKAELRSEDGKSFSFARFTIEATRRKIRRHGDFFPPWDDRITGEAFLVDDCGTAYRADSLAGKKLAVMGRLRGGEVCAYPSGPKVCPGWILVADNIEILDPGASGGVAAKWPIPKRAKERTDSPLWLGHTERQELPSADGRKFPVIALKIEKLSTSAKQKTKSLPTESPTPILVDHCYTAYHPEFNGKNCGFLIRGKIAVRGSIIEASAFPFPGGPKLLGNSSYGSGTEQDMIPVLIVETVFDRN